MKHQLYPLQVRTQPDDDLGLVVVIPCYDEPDLLSTLDSLWRCARPTDAAEVLVVVNASEADDEGVQNRNRATLRTLRRWIKAHPDPRLQFHCLDFPALPARHAGVGLARKLGMDEAAARLSGTASSAGVIVSLDADCSVEPGYLRAIETHFARHPKTPGAAIYFEHPLVPGKEGDTIARYELHLRYYVQGLRHAGSPYAFHTVGSCQAVRSQAYVRQGGMNRRQAGEDFYFVQKLIPLGNFSEINTTTVRPSPRPSHRVPFGTGKAVRDGAGEALLTYAPAVFEDIKDLFDRLDGFYRSNPADPLLLEDLSGAIKDYLWRNGFPETLAEIQANTADPASFRKRWFRWFNGFRIMKYANFASRAYPKVAVEEAAMKMLALRGGAALPAALDLRTLLQRFRRLDRAR